MATDFNEKKFGDFETIDYEDFVIRVAHDKIYGKSAKLTMKDLLSYENCIDEIKSNQDRSVFALYVKDNVYIITESSILGKWEHTILPKLWFI